MGVVSEGLTVDRPHVGAIALSAPLIAARLDRVPFSRFHARLLAIGGLAYVFDAMDVAIVAFILPVLKAQWHLSHVEIGFLAAAASMGGIAGASFGGWLGDSAGRRSVMLWALAIYSVATFASAWASRWQVFLIWRIVAGIGTSAESAIVAPFLSEFSAPTFRGRYVGVLVSLFSVGFLGASLLGYVVMRERAAQFGMSQDKLDKNELVLRGGFESIEACRRAGVKIGFGSDLLGPLQEEQSREFILRREVMTPVEIIRSATTVGAEIVRMPGQLGVIEPGALADLLVVDGNPLQNLEVLQHQGSRPWLRVPRSQESHGIRSASQAREFQRRLHCRAGVGRLRKLLKAAPRETVKLKWGNDAAENAVVEVTGEGYSQATDYHCQRPSGPGPLKLLDGRAHIDLARDTRIKPGQRITVEMS